MRIFMQGGCTREDVAAYEKKYGIHFPPDYVEFLVKYNGGKTPRIWFEFSEKLSSPLVFLMGIGDVEYCPEKEFFCPDLGFAEMLSENLFPIGKDEYGSTLLMDVGKNPGKIYFLAPEWLYIYQDENFFYYLTDSFTSFLKHCEAWPYSTDWAKKSMAEREASLIAQGRGDEITDERREIWQKSIDRYARTVYVEFEVN